MAWASLHRGSHLNQHEQTITDLAWLLVRVSKDHVQGSLMVSVQVTKPCCSECDTSNAFYQTQHNDLCPGN